MELCTPRAISYLPHHHHHRSLARRPSQLRSKASFLTKQTPVSRLTRGLHSRIISLDNSLPRATTSEDTSNGSNQYFGEKRDGVLTLEDVPAVNSYDESVSEEVAKEEAPMDEQNQMPVVELLDKLDIKSFFLEGIAACQVAIKRELVASLLFLFLVLGSLGLFSSLFAKDNEDKLLQSEDSYLILLYGGGALIALWLASAVVGAIDTIPLFPKLMEVVGLGYSFWFSYRYLLFKRNREELAGKIEELKQQILGTNDD